LSPLVDQNDNVLVEALQQVMDDGSFKINTPAIINKRKCAKMVLDKQQVCVVWTGINKKITECLQQVILSSATKSFKYNTCSASKLDMIRKVIQDDVQFCWIISTADFKINDMMTHDLLLYKINTVHNLCV